MKKIKSPIPSAKRLKPCTEKFSRSSFKGISNVFSPERRKRKFTKLPVLTQVRFINV